MDQYPLDSIIIASSENLYCVCDRHFDGYSTQPVDRRKFRLRCVIERSDGSLSLLLMVRAISSGFA